MRLIAGTIPLRYGKKTLTGRIVEGHAPVYLGGMLGIRIIVREMAFAIDPRQIKRTFWCRSFSWAQRGENTEVADEAIYCDPVLAQFYDWDNPWPKDFDYFASLVTGYATVLDLGCGTGIFSAELAARGHRVTGVDPASAMLDIARRRPGGEAVRWIEADARDLFLNEPFDMVLMTGHAFQTLLAQNDRVMLLRTIARHLRPGGRFFFDSRNPDYREWEHWTPQKTQATRHHPDYGMVERWKDARWDETDSTVTYGTFYRLKDGKRYSANSRIAFPSKGEIGSLITEAGLSVDRWIGDCSGGDFRACSPEIIPLGRSLDK